MAQECDLAGLKPARKPITEKLLKVPATAVYISVTSIRADKTQPRPRELLDNLAKCLNDEISALVTVESAHEKYQIGIAIP